MSEHIRLPKQATLTTRSVFRDASGMAYDHDDYMRWQRENMVAAVIQAIRENPALRRELRALLAESEDSE